MTDLVITAASVIAGENSFMKQGTAGEAVTAGKTAYFDKTTGRWKLADSNSGVTDARVAKGIFLNGAAAGQPVFIHGWGDITIGATLTAGLAYYLSDTPGGICPVADVGTGESVCLLGLAKSTTVLSVQITSPGVTL